MWIIANHELFHLERLRAWEMIILLLLGFDLVTFRLCFSRTIRFQTDYDLCAYGKYELWIWYNNRISLKMFMLTLSIHSPENTLIREKIWYNSMFMIMFSWIMHKFDVYLFHQINHMMKYTRRVSYVFEFCSNLFSCEFQEVRNFQVFISSLRSFFSLEEIKTKLLVEQQSMVIFEMFNQWGFH